ncbi:MAG: patatin-like phospholipase family protein [Acidobacteria bacterium]|nr:patatin-like phospholipase family protein [Acidobacteriota bacterium]
MANLGRILIVLVLGEETEDQVMSEVHKNAPVMAGENCDDQRAMNSEIALCLSGGGYRAMLFHLGALLRLNEFGYLPKLNRISSVSGGSITAGVLGLHWKNLEFDKNGVAGNLMEEVIEPVRALARVDIDGPAIAKGVLWFGSVSDRVEGAYDKHLFDGATLQDLPEEPRFVINATNLQSRSLFRFSRPYIWDWRVGKIANPQVKLARAVAASSAFPPFLSPCEMEFDVSDWVAGSGAELEIPEYRKKVILTDGGVYDNLGLETAWKSSGTILVSDGGGETPADPEPDTDWARQTKRVLDLVDYQVRSLRKRQLIAAYERGDKKGSYWGMRTTLTDYKAPNLLPADESKTIVLANTPTRLTDTPDHLQERIINWGYAVSDAAMRAWVDATLPDPGGRFPFAGSVG